MIYLLVIPVLALYALGSGLIPFKPPLAMIAAIMLTIGLGAFSLALVWWGNRWGYVSALVTGLIAVIGTSVNIRAIGRGDRPNALLLTNVPGLFFAVALVYAATLGWLG